MHTNRKMDCRYGNPIESWANESEEGKRDDLLYLHDLRREWNQSCTIRYWYLMFLVFVSSSFFDDVSTGSLACVFLFQFVEEENIQWQNRS
ncbi:hypothetical protein C7J99_13950 [Brevibacillus brevis]|nr:hypothetical protein C7J99_13950 [Brevibacillus brevis]